MSAPAPFTPHAGPLAAGAVAYDPLVLPGVLAAAGSAAWRRRWRLARVLVTFAVGFWLDARQGSPRREALQRRRAEWLKAQFVALGATFVKIGQVLSTRPDLVPLPYVEVMASLQDQVPPFDSTEARGIIERELGASIDTIFSVFNPFPIAAASIGQVYKARLREAGIDVVVKVQRPGLLPVMKLDLAILRQLTAFVDRHPWLGRGMPYTAILDEFGHSLFVQADYRAEAAFAERFRSNFESFPGVSTPRIHHGFTTGRVMVMDYVDGVKPTDLVGLADAGVSFQEIVRIGVRATIKQLLEDGFFHADVHPGNLFVDRQGSLVYIDFGMVGELSPFVQEKIVDIFLHSVHRHYAALIEDFIALEFLSPQVDRVALLPVAEHIFRSQYGETGQRLTVKEVFASVSRVLYEYPFRIPEKIAFILRTIITLEGIIHQIWPDFRFLEVATPYAAKILLTEAKANIREKLVDELFVEGQFRPDRLGKLFGAASREPTFRFGEVTPAVLRYLTAPEGRRVREGLLGMLTDRAAVPDEGAGAGWGAYVALAAQDPSWTLDELLKPLLDFLETPEGRDYVRRALAVPGLWRLADLPRPAGGGLAWDSLLTGRPLTAATRKRLFDLAEALLADPDLALQPLVERLAVMLDSAPGRRFFHDLGARLLSAPESFEGRFLAVLSQAAAHPHLDISPLVRVFFQLATGPEGKPWQELLLHWFRQPEGAVEGARGVQLEPLWRALGPLLADGRLRVSELAWPTLGWLFSEDSEALRDEVITNLRDRLPQVDWGGVANGLWRAAGRTWQRLRDALARDDDEAGTGPGGRS